MRKKEKREVKKALKIKEIIENSSIKLGKEKIIYNEPMEKHTTFKIGGPAECLMKIENKETLKQILKLAKENQIPITIIGNGSNLLVLDEGIKGIVLMIKIEDLEIKEKEQEAEIIVGAGYKLGMLAQKLLNQDLSGFEELSGIPGTIGGAVRMNAGAHGKEFKDIVEEVTAIDYDGNERTFTNEELKFEYRKSIFKEEKYIVVQAKLKFPKGKKQEISEKMKQYALYRKEKQPIEYPNAGSTFKRGEDFITAKLIDEAGLKGYCIGGAEVSTKHSGFIINKGNATAKDVLQLVDYIKQEIHNKFGKNIELEIEVVGGN